MALEIVVQIRSFEIRLQKELILCASQHGIVMENHLLIY